MIEYHIDSLDDLVKMFEGLSDRSKSALLKLQGQTQAFTFDNHRLRTEIRIWTAAADIVRATRIVSANRLNELLGEPEVSLNEARADAAEAASEGGY